MPWTGALQPSCAVISPFCSRLFLHRRMSPIEQQHPWSLLSVEPAGSLPYCPNSWQAPLSYLSYLQQQSHYERARKRHSRNSGERMQPLPSTVTERDSDQTQRNFSARGSPRETDTAETQNRRNVIKGNEAWKRGFFSLNFQSVL